MKCHIGMTLSRFGAILMYVCLSVGSDDNYYTP